MRLAGERLGIQVSRGSRLAPPRIGSIVYRSTPLRKPDAYLLLPGERVVLTTRLHVATLTRPALLVCCSILLMIPLIVLGGSAPTFVLAISALAASSWALFRFAIWRVTRFVVTDRRVLYRSGLLTFRVVSIGLQFINGATMSHAISFIPWLEFGDLTLTITGRDARRFGPLPRVGDVLNAILEQTSAYQVPAEGSAF